MMDVLQTYGILLGAVGNLFAAAMWSSPTSFWQTFGRLAFVVCAIPALLIVARHLP